MGLQTVLRLSLDFLRSRPVHVEISDALLSSDAGLLPIRQFDGQIRLTEQFAAAIKDLRDADFIRQPLLTMVRQRIYGILAGYEDQNNHDTLRSDPIFKMIADRLPGTENRGHMPLLTACTSSTILMTCRELLAPRSVLCGTTPSNGATAARPSSACPAIPAPSRRSSAHAPACRWTCSAIASCPTTSTWY